MKAADALKLTNKSLMDIDEEFTNRLNDMYDSIAKEAEKGYTEVRKVLPNRTPRDAAIVTALVKQLNDDGYRVGHTYVDECIKFIIKWK